MSRLSSKRSDKRWMTEDGSVFASKLESIVFDTLRNDPKLDVRRCEKGGSDTFNYTTPVRAGTCVECGAESIVQHRTYTPDLYIRPKGAGRNKPGFYLEVKGHFPGPRRNLLRGFLKTGPSIDLRIILQRDGKATGSLTLLEYVHKYLKLPVHIWDGVLPRGWYENTSK